MLQKYEKYDYRVQLMRIFACFIVIGCHVRMEPVINGGLDKELLLIHGFFDDGVAVFFMIIGFFLAATREPFWKSTGKTFARILVPVLLLKLFISLIGSAAVDAIPAPEALSLSEILGQFVTLNFHLGSYCTHLWYITAYLRIVILLPLLKLLTLDHPLSRKACGWILSLNIIGMLVADLQALFPSRFGMIGTFMILDIPATYVILGYVLYKNKHIFYNSRKCLLLFPAAMIGVNILRFLLQCVLFRESFENTRFYLWNTTVSLLFAVSFVCFFLAFPGVISSPAAKVINYIGAKTYFIYLIHVVMYTHLDYRYGIGDRIYRITIGISPNLITKLGYDLLYPALVFLCCLLIAVLIDCVKAPFRLICHQLSGRQRV